MKLYHFLSAQYGLAAIRDQRYKISTFNELNDPFELYAPNLTDPRIRDTFLANKKKLARIMDLLCCSKSWYSSLLWSHYADKHRGVALELDVEDSVISEISYADQRPEITSSMLDGLSRPDPRGTVGGIVLHTKASDWAYENEARIQFDIRHLKKNQGLIFMPFTDEIKLAGLVLGPLCFLSNEDIYKSLPGDKSIIIRRSKIAVDSFDVVEDV